MTDRTPEFHEGAWLKRLIAEKSSALAAAKKMKIGYRTLTRAFASPQLARCDPATMARVQKFLRMSPEEFERKRLAAALEFRKTEEFRREIEKTLSVWDMIADGAPIGEGDHFGAVDDGVDHPSRAVRVPVFARDVAAGSFEVVYGDSRPDDFVYLPRDDFHGLPIHDVFILRIKGDSMWPKYESGDNVVMRRMRLGESAAYTLEILADYCICKVDETACFKQLIEMADDEHLIFRARNTAKFPNRITVAWQEVVLLAMAVGKITYSMTLNHRGGNDE